MEPSVLAEAKGPCALSTGSTGQGTEPLLTLVLPQMPWKKGWEAQSLDGHKDLGLSDTPGSHFGGGMWVITQPRGVLA